MRTGGGRRLSFTKTFVVWQDSVALLSMASIILLVILILK